MLVTDRQELHRRVMVLRDHGRQPGDTLFRNTEIAFKYKMSSMQAALGLAQLERIDELMRKKREIFEWYRRELEAVPGLVLNHEPHGTRNAYWMVTYVQDPSIGIPKEHVIRELATRGIDSRPFFYPLSSLEAYRSTPKAREAERRNAVSYRLSACGVNLPSALSLDEAQVRRTCGALKEILAARVGTASGDP